ncbi:MAG TPA: SPOR domain-containing protein [Terriglobales bacterium]|nr:SPOR domain-containing protein [Terriglobales bacterium]
MPAPIFSRVVCSLGLGLTLVLFAPLTQAQVFRIGAGSSSLLDAQGGSLEIQSRNYKGQLGVGVLDGKLRFGALVRTKYLGHTWTLGDDSIRFAMPTDIFDNNYYFLGRGLSVAGTWRNTRFLAFAGATSNSFGTPFFRAAQVDQTAAVLFLDHPVTERLSVFSRNILSRQQTSIHGLEFKARPWLKTSFSAGTGAGQPYLALSADAERDWFAVKAAYIDAGDRFRRVLVETPIHTEVDGANLQVTLRPRHNLTIVGGHQNLLQPPGENSQGLRATVNNLQASTNWSAIRLGGGVYQSSVLSSSNLGTFIWASRRITDRIDTTVNYYRSQPNRGQAASTISATVREVISPRLELLQLVTNSNGQTTVSFGGHFTSNRFSLGVDYQTLYVPFRANPFTQALSLTLRFRPFGSVDLNAQTYVTPEGKLRYTAFGNSSLYRYSGLHVGERAMAFSLPKYLIRGRVEDEQGAAISGAALQIDNEVAFSDTNGEFFVRVKRQRAYPVRVLLDQFLVPGYYAVVSSPATVAARPEEEAVPFAVVLRRVKPPARPIHTASAGGSETTSTPERNEPPPVTPPAAANREAGTVRFKQLPTGSLDYVVQVAALSSAASADKLANELRQKRYPVLVLRASSGASLYRVQVGPFRSKREAQAAQEQLSQEGFTAMLKTSPEPAGLAVLRSASTSGL